MSLVLYRVTCFFVAGGYWTLCHWRLSHPICVVVQWAENVPCGPCVSWAGVWNSLCVACRRAVDLIYSFRRHLCSSFIHLVCWLAVCRCLGGFWMVCHSKNTAELWKMSSIAVSNALRRCICSQCPKQLTKSIYTCSIHVSSILLNHSSSVSCSEFTLKDCSDLAGVTQHMCVYMCVNMYVYLCVCVCVCVCG